MQSPDRVGGRDAIPPAVVGWEGGGREVIIQLSVAFGRMKLERLNRYAGKKEFC